MAVLKLITPATRGNNMLEITKNNLDKEILNLKTYTEEEIDSVDKKINSDLLSHFFEVG